MPQQLRHLGKSISITLAVILTMVLQPNLTGSAASAYFFYFNPDSSLSNLTSLKQTMDTLLNAEGLSYAFQSFTRFQDFNRQVQEAKPTLLFLPDWYLKQDGNDKKFKPLMIPMRHGATTYRKVLLVAADSPLTMATLPEATIAMTHVGQAGLTLLNDTLFKDSGVQSEKLNIITTAKDTDALFALTLGQVKAAIISQDNLNTIGQINPKILKTVKQLAVSEPMPLPVLCYADSLMAKADLDKLKSLLRAGKEDHHIAKLMEQLDIDAWKDPTP